MRLRALALLVASITLLGNGPVCRGDGDSRTPAGARIAGPRGESVPVVNEGKSLELRALDAAGNAISASNWQSDSPSIAEVTPGGSLQGIRYGFATISAQTPLGLAKAIVAVARVTRRMGERVSGDTKTDTGGNVYLSSPRSHVVYRVAGSATSVLAGSPGQSGFKNGKGAKVRFNTPAGLAVDNRAQGGVFVADTANHSIRRVDSSGAVTAIVGGPAAGGTMTGDVTAFDRARLGDARGVAVVGGDLFFTDTSAHAVYYADFRNRQIRLLAGEPGVPGGADGRGRQARFSRPSGLAANSDGTLLAVADAGNGVVRLIGLSREGAGDVVGEVTTLGLASSARGADIAASRVLDDATSAIPFTEPHSVSIDGLGNVYVVDTSGAIVITRSNSGVDVVALAQEGTLGQAASITTGGTRVLVLDEAAEANEAVVAIEVGGPVITSVDPSYDRLEGGAEVTITGANFAPESLVVLGDRVVENARVVSAREIRFTVPSQEGPGGRTLTVATRGGVAQRVFAVEAPPLSELSPGEITTIAGGVAFNGDGGLANDHAVIANPIAVAVGSDGDVFFAEPDSERVRRVDAATGLITTVAGTGQRGFSGDGGPAVSARLDHPSGVAVDSAGNLYISDAYNVRVRRVDAVTRLISTFAGSGSSGFSGDGGPATAAELSGPSALAADAAGNIYIADSINNRIRRVDSRGIITTFAGSSQRGFAGDGGPATAARLNQPTGIAFDHKGNLVISDTQNQRIRRVETRTGVIKTIAGNGTLGLAGDGGPARKANLYLPAGLTVDGLGNVFIADAYSHRVRRVDAVAKTIETVAGTIEEGFNGDEIPGVTAQLNFPLGVAVDGAGMLYIADLNNGRVRRLDTVTGVITTAAGGCGPDAGGDGGRASGGVLFFPGGLAAGPDGSIYIADTSHNRVRRIDPDGVIDTFAGGCSFEFGEDNIPAVDANLAQPMSVAVDSAGRVYIAEAANHRIRRVDTNGIITTVAGNGTRSSDGDGGPATQAGLFFPTGVAVDTSGNIYIADSANCRIRRVDANTGIITTVAGTVRGFGGDGGPATAALLDNPRDITVDTAGNLYIADTYNNRIRRVDSATGAITTFAEGVTGALTVDSSGRLVVVNIGFHSVVRFPVGGGSPTVIAGDGNVGFSGDGGPATLGRFRFPNGIAIGGDGVIYVADTGNHSIRAIK